MEKLDKKHTCKGKDKFSKFAVPSRSTMKWMMTMMFVRMTENSVGGRKEFLVQWAGQAPSSSKRCHQIASVDRLAL